MCPSAFLPARTHLPAAPHCLCKLQQARHKYGNQREIVKYNCGTPMCSPGRHVCLSSGCLFCLAEWGGGCGQHRSSSGRQRQPFLAQQLGCSLLSRLVFHAHGGNLVGGLGSPVGRTMEQGGWARSGAWEWLRQGLMPSSVKGRAHRTVRPHPEHAVPSPPHQRTCGCFADRPWAPPPSPQPERRQTWQIGRAHV